MSDQLTLYTSVTFENLMKILWTWQPVARKAQRNAEVEKQIVLAEGNIHRSK
jgi:hypothetical protein